MNISLLSKEIQEYIDQHLGASISKLALEIKDINGVNRIDILNQIEAKAKAKDKLPTWFDAKDIIYPSKVSMEQTSSEKTAAYKSGIVAGETLIDLTGGFGVDSYYFAKKMKSVLHCEIDEELHEIAKHNWKQLQAKNIISINGNGIEILENSNTQYNWIYVDPSRRNGIKGKVFMLKDCLPDVPSALARLFEKSNSILIKTSPLLDISAGMKELTNVKAIHIVSVENEVKELLWELHKDFSSDVEIKTINIKKKEVQSFSFKLNNKPLSVEYSLPKKFLYEPNSSIMKSGGFDEVGVHFKLEKLHVNSHLYTSDNIIPFPGRVFEIYRAFPYGKNEMKTNMQDTNSNVSVRNFPLKPDEIKKKWKIGDGGDVYSFFTTDKNNVKIVLLCKKTYIANENIYITNTALCKYT